MSAGFGGSAGFEVTGLAGGVSVCWLGCVRWRWAGVRVTGLVGRCVGLCNRGTDGTAASVGTGGEPTVGSSFAPPAAESSGRGTEPGNGTGADLRVGLDSTDGPGPDVEPGPSVGTVTGSGTDPGSGTVAREAGRGAPPRCPVVSVRSTATVANTANTPTSSQAAARPPPNRESTQSPCPIDNAGVSKTANTMECMTGLLEQHSATSAVSDQVDRDRFGTHRVTNQVPPCADYDPLSCDPGLVAALERDAGGVTDQLQATAALVGSAQGRAHARLANENEPVLHGWDRCGNRIDEVEFHPSWHWLMEASVRAGNTAAPWAPGAGPHAHTTRAASFYLMSQLEQGHCCPITMTYAAIPALRHDPELARRYEPGLRSTVYAPGLAEPSGKAGLLAGMSMTEKQGGSDVRAGTTTATPQPDGSYRLVGHKWFTSAPMNDLFLTLAQAPDGLTCFLLPRVLPDATRNPIRLQRLKDKLGNRSNASSEIEYQDAVGWRLGEEGRGVRTILEMVTMTRLDCVLGSAAIMRIALSEAAHHVAHRRAFGTRLADAPLMAAVLAELAVESEASTALALRLAGAVDRGESDLLRLALPVTKYQVCKRTSAVVAEAQEALGGNGYVEESELPRLYREAPLNSIWEGSGNVTALDALRAITRSPDSVAAVLAEIDKATGESATFDAAVRELRGELAAPQERRARRLAELTAVCLQGSLLLQHAPSAVTEVFLASRFGEGSPLRTAGTHTASNSANAAVLTRITPIH